MDSHPPHSASKGMNVLVTSIVFLVLAVVSVIFRLIARVGYVKNPGSDDVAIFVALLTCIPLIVGICHQVENGLGRHNADVNPEQVPAMLTGLWIAIISYNLSLTCIKVSIILQYLRVFPGKKIRFWCWATIAIVAAYGIEAVVSAIFTCVPINTFWLGGGRCIDRKAIWFFNAAFNILSDLVILALPMPVLSGLKLPLKQKIGLIFVFALGGFVTLVSVLRLRGLRVASDSNDPAWDNADVAIWSSIEVTTGIICASMPATKPMVSHFFPRLLSTNHSRQPTLPSQGRSHKFHSTVGHSTTPVRLMEVTADHKTVTRVEVGSENYRERDVERNSVGDENGSGGKHGQEIFVTTSMTQDVERKSEMGSEKDLIIQLN